MTFTTFDPATGERIADIETTTSAQLDAAVATAYAEQRAWAARSGTERGRILHVASRLLRESLPALAELECQDTGKPISETRNVDVNSAADALEFYAGVAATLHGGHHDLGTSFVYTRREPLGVCAGIGAWNYPLQIAAWKAAPALACGNAMIFKPSELTPLTAMKLEETFIKAGLPPGLFKVVQGDGELGRSLASHPGIAKVSLTGSVSTGRGVMAGAAQTLKQVTLELGGKSPLLIFADADLEQAVSAAMMANFYTQGEICSNGTRVFVDASIKDAFLDVLIPRVERLRIGDPKDPDTHVGALISAKHLDKVRGYVEAGKKSGAQLLCGGTTPTWTGNDTKLRQGHFIRPAVFDQCRDDMSIVQDEIFGPVMSVLTFHSEEEAIQRANATPFGLASGVFTRDLARAHRVAGALQAGICWINNYNITPVEVPFGGVKGSGIGRENGLEAIHHYTQVKTVYVEMGRVDCPYP